MSRKNKREQARVEQGATKLTAALQHADGVLWRKAVVLVVSDFITTDEWQPTLRRMAQRHKLVAGLLGLRWFQQMP